MAPVLYLSLVLFAVIPAILLLAFLPMLVDAWCEEREIPQYERALGFKFGPVPVADDGETQVSGIVWVDPHGPLGLAGVRSGDVPRTYHGIREFCGVLESVTHGDSATLEVLNVADVGNGQAGRRKVVIPGHAR
jgi:hypothetical protein